MIQIDELRPLCRVTNTDQDSLLRELELGAVDLLQTRSGRYYGRPSEVTQYVEGLGIRDLWLPDGITAGSTPPATVVERSAPGGTPVTITGADNDGFLVRGEQLGRLVRRGGLVWTRGYEYEVTYTRGFDEGAEPARARQFVRQCVAWWFERRVPAPKPGEVYTAPLPLHLDVLLRGLTRILV